MDGQTIFAALRDALAELYPEEQDTRVVVADAGLDAKQIAFSSRAQTNWHNILAEALQQHRIDALLAVVLSTYKDNPKLQTASVKYYHFIKQGGYLAPPARLPEGYPFFTGLGQRLISAPLWQKIVVIIAIFALVSGIAANSLDVLQGVREAFATKTPTSTATPTLTPTVPTAIPTITPLPTATPLAFAPANANESLIIVADFDDRSGGRYQGIDPAQYVFEQLDNQLRASNSQVRINRLHQIIDDNTAQAVGNTYHATLVLWGWYDALSITPRVERIAIRSGYQSTEESVHFSLVDPKKLELSIVRDVPAHAVYLTLLIVGLERLSSSVANDAQQYFENAIEAVRSLPSFNRSEAHFFLGNTYLYNRNYNEAEQQYTEAIFFKQDFAGAYANLGTLALLKGKDIEAKQDYTQAIKLDPKLTIAYINLALLEAQNENVDNALTLVSQAVELADSYQVLAYGARGAIYLQLGRWREADEDLSQAVKLDEGFALAYQNRGLARVKLGQMDEAVSDLTQAIQLAPDLAEAYYNRATAYSAKNNLNLALKDLTKALELEPTGLLDVPDLVSLPYLMGLAEEAQRLRTESRKSTFRAQVYEARGLVDERIGAREAAIADYLSAGDLYLQVTRVSQVPFVDAIRELPVAVIGSEATPTPEPIEHYAQYPLIELDQTGRAITNYSKVLALDPTNAAAYLGRGRTYAFGGSNELAEADLRKCLELATDSTLRAEAERQLQTLRQP